MPRMLDTEPSKWMYAPGEQLCDYMTVDGPELLSIRDWTETAWQAYVHCIENNKIPPEFVTLLNCITEEGEPHQVCRIGSFAIDHKLEWPVKIEDLEYTWIS